MNKLEATTQTLVISLSNLNDMMGAVAMSMEKLTLDVCGINKRLDQAQRTLYHATVSFLSEEARKEVDNRVVSEWIQTMSEEIQNGAEHTD